MRADTPSWRNPTLWLVVALPLAILVACVTLVRQAAGPGATDAALEPVRRMAQVQTTDLDADIAAANAGLAFHLELGADAVRVRGRIASSERALRLRLRHPVDTQQDRALDLVRAGDAWQANAALPRTHDWLVTLAPLDGGWRVVGRLPRGDTRLRLAPALQATR